MNASPKAMTSGSRFECYVTVDGSSRKHTICLNSVPDVNGCTFGDVYREVRRSVPGGPGMSYESHVFESFDFQTQAFKRLQSFGQRVPYLSRIRVSVKQSATAPAPASRPAPEQTLSRRQKKKLMRREVDSQLRDGSSTQNSNNKRFREESDQKSVINKALYNQLPVPAYADMKTAIGHSFDAWPSMASGSGTRQQYVPKVVDYSTDNKYGIIGQNNRNNNNNNNNNSFQMDFDIKPNPKSILKRNPQTNSGVIGSGGLGSGIPRSGISSAGTSSSGIASSGIYSSNITSTGIPSSGADSSWIFSQGGHSGRSGSGLRPAASPPPPADEVAVLRYLETEGLAVSGNGKAYCPLCVQILSSHEEALAHVQSDGRHRTYRSESRYQKIDTEFLTECGADSKAQRVIARRLESRRFNDDEKRQLMAHGVRLHDGAGGACYICLSCRLSLDSETTVRRHMALEGVQMPGRNPKRRTQDEPLSGLRVLELAAQGVEYWRQKDKYNNFKCRLCDNSWFVSEASLASHLRSDNHREKRRFVGIDRLLLAPEIELCDGMDGEDGELLMARKKQLYNWNNDMKERALLHGLRVLKGSGERAVVCLACNVFLGGKGGAQKHLDLVMPTLPNNPRPGTEGLSRMTEAEILALMIEDGIERRALAPKQMEKGGRGGRGAKHSLERWYCLFCALTYKTRATAIAHMTCSPAHLALRRADRTFLRPADGRFLMAEPGDNPGVARARMQVLDRLDDRQKVRYTEAGLRLTHGIGARAYVCLTCETAIPSDGPESAVQVLDRHVSGREHSVYAMRRV